jgi:hypothetical protein
VTTNASSFADTRMEHFSFKAEVGCHHGVIFWDPDVHDEDTPLIDSVSLRCHIVSTDI